MASKILVTTPSGKVGTEVAKQLLSQHANIRIGAHTVEKAKKDFPGAEIVALDLNDEQSVRAALQGISAVYLATPGDWPAAPEQRLIDLAKAAGVKRIVKLSVIGIEHADGSAIREVEKHLEKSGLEYTFVRPTWFMQNFSTSMAGSIQGGVLAEPADDKTNAFIDARDIAAVAVKALTEDGHSGKAYTITGPELLTRAQVAAKLSKAIGREVRYVNVTDAQFREAVKPYLSTSYLELMSALYSYQRAGAYEVKTDTVEKVLGRPPRTFDAFAKDHAAAWK